MASTAASAAPSGAGALPWWGTPPDAQSGPAVARVFQRAFALVLLCAWLSLAVQVPVLIGSRGLLPAAEFFAELRRAGVSFFDAPTLLWLAHGDAVLIAGAALGCALALAALLGVRPRLCFALSAPLYLSYATACDDFTAFQWDNLLVETALLAAFLPADRRAPLAHFAFRVLLFKLYFESGIAKWQSHLHDWHDGSAMRFYYETAPLPAALAWHAHRLPARWHELESWGALVLELIVPLFVFGPRPFRLLAFAAFTGFQVANTATANYGYFTYLSLVLHVFLLGDADVRRARALLAARAPRLLRPLPTPADDSSHLKSVNRQDAADAKQPNNELPGVFGASAVFPSESRVVTNPEPPKVAAGPVPEPRARPAWLRAAAALALGAWLSASLVSALAAFLRSGPPPRTLRAITALHAPFRVANTYHLFGHITRERIEPQFETREGERWREHDLRFKPGDPRRRLPYVAPHQPRVDFRLWFYGLSFRRGMPRYVHNLLERLCHEPRAVAGLFSSELPAAPDAVRVAFFRYHMTDREQRSQTGAYWRRQRLGALPERRCR